MGLKYKYGTVCLVIVSINKTNVGLKFKKKVVNLLKQQSINNTNVGLKSKNNVNTYRINLV